MIGAMRSPLSSLPLVLSLLSGAALLHAHPGGVDDSGCHADRVAGDSHCHPERAAGAKKDAEVFTGKVVAVKDGDTVEVLREGKAVRVRLFGVDCPEKDQAFGQMARRFTSQRVFGRSVTVRVKDTDRYGRTVAEVVLEKGRTLNQELVQAGLAWWYQRYAPGEQLLAKLEAEAREAKRGLWSDAQAVAPWLFRRKPRGGV